MNSKEAALDIQEALNQLRTLAAELELPDLMGVFRRRLGLNQFDFAKAVDIPNYVLSRYEMRKSQIPLEHQRRILDFLTKRLAEVEAQESR